LLNSILISFVSTHLFQNAYLSSFYDVVPKWWTVEDQ